MKLPHALRALRHRNLRLFFAGQSVSLIGTWMQSVAQGWLVYRLTHSSALLGVIAFVGQSPALLLGVWAGSLADRVKRQKMVTVTQTVMTVQSFILAVDTLGGWVKPWHIVVLAAMLGTSNAIEIPARQAFLADIAGEDMPNAIAMNSSITNFARIIGPSLAGLVVAVLGEGWCFLLNALSFAGTLYALSVIEAPQQPRAETSGRRHLMDGIAYAGKTAHVRALLALLAVVSFFALPYTTLLPVFAADVLHGGPALLGLLYASAGVGALTAAISLLRRRGLQGLGRRVAVGASCMGVGLVLLGLSRWTLLSQLALAIVGFGFISQSAGTMTLLQGLSPATMRGRVMGFFSMLFMGIAPFGALAGGWAAHAKGAPRVVMVGGAAVALASVVFHLALPRLRKTVLAQYPTLFPPMAPQ